MHWNASESGHLSKLMGFIAGGWVGLFAIPCMAQPTVTCCCRPVLIGHWSGLLWDLSKSRWVISQVVGGYAILKCSLVKCIPRDNLKWPQNTYYKGQFEVTTIQGWPHFSFHYKSIPPDSLMTIHVALTAVVFCSQAV